MMPVTIIALLFLNFPRCRGKCSDVRHENGTIQSPNYGKEYTKKANCSWRITGDQNSAILLQLVAIKIFHTDETTKRKKECDDSYRLILNGDTVDCKLEIYEKDAKDGQNTKEMCYMFPHPTCQYVSGFQDCSMKPAAKQVTVQYIANGSSSSGNQFSHFMKGFKMRYSRVPCHKDNFVQNPSAAPPTTRAPRTRTTKITAHTASRTRTPMMTRIGRRTSIPKVTPIPAMSTQGADSQATVRQPSTFASSTQSVEATAGSDSSAIAGGIIGILVVIALGAAILYFLKRRQTNGQLQPRDGAHRSQQATDDMYAAIGENGATGASAVAYRARDQNTAVTQENVLYGTTTYPFDQSYAEPSDTSTQVAYAQVDRSAKRRGRQPNDGAASPPPSRSGADIYAVVKKDRAPAPDTAD